MWLCRRKSWKHVSHIVKSNTQKLVMLLLFFVCKQFWADHNKMWKVCFPIYIAFIDFWQNGYNKWYHRKTHSFLLQRRKVKNIVFAMPWQQTKNSLIFLYKETFHIFDVILLTVAIFQFFVTFTWDKILQLCNW